MDSALDHHHSKFPESEWNLAEGWRLPPISMTSTPSTGNTITGSPQPYIPSDQFSNAMHPREHPWMATVKESLAHYLRPADYLPATAP
ncbi:hypothetical protein FA13DRAFT_146260 [Coprinellus micaceus]|uniref:Uncharacterized protein n=1 Tax=Coprinellus micaceus TaxID=71717 RepID=A0A4Y7SHA8_COPMI|nr:hypothetical protein FA13DRAFT_146260 [Coprinellus micaceus]